MVMFGHKTKRTPTPRSVLLAEALQIYEGSLCRGCGQSSLVAYDPRNTGEWERRTDVVCAGCEELGKGDESDAPAGTITYLHNHLSDGRQP